jgi:hypothetical protein
VISRHQSVLEFARGRYFKLALLVSAAAIGSYWWVDVPNAYAKPYGGTWLGYALGTIAAALILWLMLLGIRKRRYASELGTVQGWTSAHVYLGVALIVVATLHCGFEFGWNIHTLAYALMMLVIVSGIFGVYAYLRYPQFMTANLGDETLESMLLTVRDLEAKCRRIALDLPDEFNELVTRSIRKTTERSPLSGSLWRQLAGVDPRHPMRVARDRLIGHGVALSGEQSAALEQLVSEMTRIVVLTDRVRTDLRYRALLQVWLYFHVPLSFGLLAALIAHVVSVFYFW